MTPHLSPAASVDHSLDHSIDSGNPNPHAPALETAMPWLTSFVFHAGVGLLVAFVFYIAVTPILPKTSDIGPIYSIPENDDPTLPTGSKPHGIGENPQLPTFTALPSQSNGFDPHGTATGLLKDTAGLGSTNPFDIGMISTGTGGSVGTGQGNGTGIAGLLAAHGRTGGGGTSIIFPPVPPKVTSVVYLLDHSGSMLDSFDYLRNEVITRTRSTLPVQKFSVIMFSEEVTTLGPDKLQPATTDVKRDIESRISAIRAQGQNDDLLIPFQKGFEKAFAMKPQVIIFLTDGNFDPRLVDVVAKLNKDKSVTIQTIAFVQIGKESEANLKKIADDNKGKYKFVSKKDLGE